jgi:hypothetical protein
MQVCLLLYPTRSYSIPSTGQLTPFWMRPPTRGSRFVAILEEYLFSKLKVMSSRLTLCENFYNQILE